MSKHIWLGRNTIFLQAFFSFVVMHCTRIFLSCGTVSKDAILEDSFASRAPEFRHS
uniref:AlNc14C255G9711 protein n=1 Tax=Albugo laibachii Nc14 TaxID=890382 RepID=F0WTN4_9STRA|nr:AlNc14C255G9711 [Albugo laibachii Nc14]|eukprot:CCA24726.1 AlNc14C255G9711 [Albugo laibachii Nc14]